MVFNSAFKGLELEYEVKKKTLEVLNNISTEEFQKCFQQWEKRWHKCIESKGEYFEGD